MGNIFFGEQLVGCSSTVITNNFELELHHCNVVCAMYDPMGEMMMHVDLIETLAIRQCAMDFRSFIGCAQALYMWNCSDVIVIENIILI